MTTLTSTSLLEEMKKWHLKEIKVIDNVAHGHSSIDFGIHFSEPSSDDFDEWDEDKNEEGYDDVRDTYTQAVLDSIADQVGETYEFFNGIFRLNESGEEITCEGFYYPNKKQIGKGLRRSLSISEFE